MLALWTADDITVLLRWMLMLNAALGSVAIESLYRKSDDANPVPWRATSALFTLYAANVAVLIFANELVVDDWYRPVFSILNILAIGMPVWLLARTIRLHRLKSAALGWLAVSPLPVAPERRSGVDRRASPRAAM